MSHEIVRSITFRKDEVHIKSTSNNVSPRVFEDWTSSLYNEIYRQNGVTAVLKEISKDIWDGNFRLTSSGTKYVGALSAALSTVSDKYPDLRHFLDTEHGAQLLANAAVKYLDTHTLTEADFAPYEALRSDPTAVLQMCKRNWNAFHYAEDNVLNDREAVKAYITTFCDDFPYSIPGRYRSDKDMAMQCLPENGRIYRQLNPDLKSDKEIILLAYAENFPGRRQHENNPSHIPPDIRKDRPFMREVLSVCPSFDISRSPELLNDRETALLAAQVCEPAHDVAKYFPEKHLKDPEIQKHFLYRCKDPQDMQKILDIYSEHNLPNPVTTYDANPPRRRKPSERSQSAPRASLAEKIASASAKAAQAEQGREAPAKNQFPQR